MITASSLPVVIDTEYPIPDGPDGRAGLDLNSSGGRSVVTSVLTSSLFVLTVGMLYVLFLPLA